MKIIACLATLIIFANIIFADFSITILHTNDIHSRIEQTDKYGGLCSSKQKLAQLCYGGIARLSTKVEEIRQRGKHVFLFDGGDQQTGTLWYDAWKGNATARMIKELKYDAVVLGNHDFDGGVTHAVKYLEILNTTVVMSNVDVKDEPKWPKKRLFQTSLVLGSGSDKIGVCGYLLKSTTRISNPGPNIKFSDEVKAVRDCAKAHTAAGIDKIVVVGHSGIKMDKKIASEVEDIDVLIGGHSNTFLYTGQPPSNDIPYGNYPLIIKRKDGRKCLVVQDFAYGKYLGSLDVTFDSNGNVKSWGGNPLLLDYTVKESAKVLAIIASMRGPVDKIGKVELGKSLVYLDGDRSSCRSGECVLGNLITDAAIHNSAINNSNNSRWTNASVCLWTSNSIISSIDISKTDYIRHENIKSSFPYLSKLDMVEIKGDVLMEALELSASSYAEKRPNGANLQVSGLMVNFDLSKPSGQRVTQVEVCCADCRFPKYGKLMKSNTYKVILSNYMANGGVGYGFLKSKSIRHYSGQITDIQAIGAYIKARTPLIISTGNRINIIHSSGKATSGSIRLKQQLPLSLVSILLVALIPNRFLKAL